MSDAARTAEDLTITCAPSRLAPSPMPPSSGMASRRIGKLVPFLMLMLLGCIWGLVMPLSSMAMAKAGKLDPIGLSTVVSVVGAAVFFAMSVSQGSVRRLTRREIGYFALWAAVSIAGQCLLFVVMRHVPSSTVSVIVILDSLMVFAMAALFGLEAASPKRLLGLVVGLGGLAVLLGLTHPVSTGIGVMTLLALGVPLGYAMENLLIASRWPARIDAWFGLATMQTIAALIGGSLALLTGSRIPLPSGADRASLMVLPICLCIAAANWLFQALVKRSGCVFASQNSYVVTVAGIAWSVLLLDEALPPSFWIGAAAVLLGIVIVQPKRVSAKDGRRSDGFPSSDATLPTSAGAGAGLRQVAVPPLAAEGLVRIRS